VCGLDHKSGRLNAIVDDNNAKGRFIPFDNIDVADRDAMKDVAQRIKDEVGFVQVVVNTVGGFSYGEAVHEISPTTWQKMMNLNVHSLLNSAAAFVPGMIEQGQGKFIAVGSKASLAGGGKTGAYAAAKGAVLRLIESMSAELKSKNIQANCVLPGTIDTPENRREMPNADTSKWVTPEQVAQVIQFLASPEADGITGAALPIFGG
jgi:NAD(P)-dependent dehydrogenase (short-subunit alcohol dehydrogenase family)